MDNNKKYLVQKNIFHLYADWQKMKLKLMAKKLRADM